MSAGQERVPQPRQLGNIQALRAAAAMLVVLIHAGLPNVGVESIMSSTERPWLTPFSFIGLFGVDLFFVISGFIMIVTNWESFGGSFAGLRFFVRRAIRIYPPYWFALAPVLVVFAFAKDQFMGAHSGVKTGIIESLLLLPNPHKFVLTVGWTLVWEMLFYVVFAFVLQLPRARVGAALAIWFAAQLGLYFVWTGAANFYLNFIATPLPLEFIFGTLVGRLYLADWFPAPRLAAALAAAVAVAMSVWVSAAHLLLDDPNDITRVLVFGIPAALLVYGAVALEARNILVAPRALQAVGDGSYAIYLWHLSILVVVRHLLERYHPAGPLVHGAILAVTLGAIVALGLGVYRFFERPVTAYLNGLLGPRATRSAQPASLGRKISGGALK